MKKEEITISEVMNKYRLEDFHHGNEQLFADMLTAFSGPLKYKLSQMIGTRDRALRVEDIIQDTMLQLWKNRKALKSFSSLWSYTSKIAYNECLSCLASNDNKTEFLPIENVIGDKDRSLQDQVERKLALAQIYTIAKNELSPASRIVFIKHYFGEMTHVEIAKENGTAVTTSRANLSGAWDQLDGKLVYEN